MYPVVVSAAGKDEKAGMRKGGKTKKTAFRQTEKPYFFYFISTLREEKKQLPL